MISPGLGITLEGVDVSGLVQGLPGEEGTWQYPRVLHLGQLAPKSDHRFRLGVLVPVPCRIDSQVSDLEVEPRDLAPGANEVILRLGGLSSDTRLDGRLVLSSAVKCRITVCGQVLSADAGPAGPGPDPQSYLWLPPDWWSLTGRTPSHPAPEDSGPATGFDALPTPPNGAAGPVRQPPTVVVSPTDETQYRTVGDAIRDVEPGTRIVVRPGVYKESLVVDKRLELIGDGPREQIIIEGTPCLRLQTDWARVQNLSLPHRWRKVAGGPMPCQSPMDSRSWNGAKSAPTPSRAWPFRARWPIPFSSIVQSGMGSRLGFSSSTTAEAWWRSARSSATLWPGLRSGSGAAQPSGGAASAMASR